MGHTFLSLSVFFVCCVGGVPGVCGVVEWMETRILSLWGKNSAELHVQFIFLRSHPLCRSQDLVLDNQMLHHQVKSLSLIFLFCFHDSLSFHGDWSDGSEDTSMCNIRSVTGVTVVCVPPCVHWGLNLSSPEEQPHPTKFCVCVCARSSVSVSKTEFVYTSCSWT